jgi:hypothetical protein
MSLGYAMLLMAGMLAVVHVRIRGLQRWWRQP